MAIALDCGRASREVLEVVSEVGSLLDEFTGLTNSILGTARKVQADRDLKQALAKAFVRSLTLASIPVLGCPQKQLQELVAERLGGIADGTEIKSSTLEGLWAMLREGLFVFRNGTDGHLRFCFLPVAQRRVCLRKGRDPTSLVMTVAAAAEVGLASEDEVAICPFDARELTVNGWPPGLPIPLGFVDVFSALYQTGTAGDKALSRSFRRTRTIPITFLTSGTILGRRTGMSWETLRQKTEPRLGWGMSLRDTANLFLKAGSRVAVADVEVLAVEKQKSQSDSFLSRLDFGGYCCWRG